MEDKNELTQSNIAKALGRDQSNILRELGQNKELTGVDVKKLMGYALMT
jgi:IS30 family transposase